MFSRKQLAELDTDYFDIVTAEAGSIVLKSRCTGHYWLIQGRGVGASVTLKHKHRQTDPWHDQPFFQDKDSHVRGHSLEAAIDAIRRHDTAVLAGKTGSERGF